MAAFPKRPGGRDRTPWLARFLALALVALPGKAQGQTPPPGGPPSVEAGAGTEAALCRVVEVGRDRLRLNGRDTYVEPQALVFAEGRLLLGGTPTYEWSRDPDGAPVWVRDRILGVLLEGDEVRGIPWPPEIGPLGWVRVAYAGEGRWLWLLEEVTSRDFAEERPVAVAWAEYRDGAWGPVRRLATPAGTEFAFHGSSRLLAPGGSVGWLLPVATPRGAVRTLAYRYRQGTWAYETVDSLRVEATDLAAHPSTGVWSALTGLDAEAGHARTFRLLREGDPPAARRRLVAMDQPIEISSPRLAAGPRGVVAGWISRAPGVERIAWGASGIGTAQPSGPLRVDPASDQVIPVALENGPDLWLVHHLGSPGTGEELRVYRARPGPGAERIASFPHPYRGYFAAVATGPSELAVVGPESTSDPTQPAVRSLLIRLSVSCL